MRRVLIACGVAAVVLVAVAFPQAGTNSVPGKSPSAGLIVVADAIAARGLAIGPQDSLYLTLASPLNRMFACPTTSVTASFPGAAVPLTPIAGTGVAGSLGDGGSAASAQLDLGSPLPYERSGVAVANDGTIYLADSENSTVRRIAGPDSTEPGVIRSVAGRWAPRQNITLSRPLGIALDSTGNLYVADYAAGSLDMLSQGSGLLETLAQVSYPASVAVRADGSEAYVASPETDSVFAVDLPSKSLHIVQGLPNQTTAPSGTATTAPCSSGSDRLCPAGLAVDGAGSLFVSDFTFGRILRIDRRTNAATTVLTGLQQPGAIAFDQRRRNLYVVEQGRNRIVEAQNMGDPPGPLSISPATFTYPAEPLGGVSQVEQFTLTNNTANSISGVTLAFQPTAPAMQSDYTLQSTSCLSTLAAGASCTANVTFTPSSLTDATLGTLSSALVASDADNDSASAGLSGVADDYQLQLASGQPQELTVIPGDAATFHLQLVSYGAFGQNGEQVSIQCPSNVPARSTCTVTPLTVPPTVGAASAFTVTIQTSSATSQAKVMPPLPLPGELRLVLVLLGSSLFGTYLFVVSPRRFRAVPVCMLLLVIGVTFEGCHHTTVSTTATPTGPATILVQGSALSQNGSPLNASRGVTIILDVALR